MPVSAGMHESGPRRPGEGTIAIALHNFPRTPMGEGRDPSFLFRRTPAWQAQLVDDRQRT
jgi:hypothetical protein